MEKTLLVAGKGQGDNGDFASGAALHGRTVVMTSDSQNNEENSAYHTLFWNRTSSLSARTVILNCVNIAAHLDEIALVFDEAQYAARFVTVPASEIEIALDEMVLGYQYLTQELIMRFTQRKLASASSQAAKLAFIYKPNSTLAESILSPSRVTSDALSYPLVAAAGAAFKAYAENIAATLAENSVLTPLLVHCDQSNELSRRDNALAIWLCEYFDSLDDPKRRPTSKQLVSWVKAGAKRTSFSLW